MGSRTDEYLASLLNDSYKREVDSDEAVWRSLPFFGAMLGLTIALLPQIYRSAAGTAGLWWQIPIYTLLAVSVILFAIAAGWFWAVIRPREYRYPPPDVAILEYAEALRAFHQAEGSEEAEQDERVRDELRAFILDEFARTTTNNRRNNNAKLRARSQVLLFAMAGFLVAFVCEATILASQAFSPAGGQNDGGWNGRKQSDGASAGEKGPGAEAGRPSGAAGTPMGLGGRELPPASQAEGRAEVSDSPPPTPTPPAPPPERPAPEWLKKDDSHPGERR